MFPSPVSLARAQNGQLTAFRELVERLQDLAFAHALALVGDPRVAEHVARHAFVEAWRRIGEVQDAERFPRWLLRRVERQAEATLGELLRSGARAEPGPRAGEPELLAQVRSLPKAAERSVVLLVHLAGRTPDTAAPWLGVAPSEVQSRLAVAHRRLKKRAVRHLDDELAPLRPSRDRAFVEGVLRTLAA